MCTCMHTQHTPVAASEPCSDLHEARGAKDRTPHPEIRFSPASSTEGRRRKNGGAGDISGWRSMKQGRLHSVSF